MSKDVKTIKDFLDEPENFTTGDLIRCEDPRDVEDFNSSPGEIFLERVDENIYEIKKTTNEIQNSKKAEEYKRCPSCDEEIRVNANLCKHCGKRLLFFGKEISNSEPIKFDLQSKRESYLNGIIILGIIIGIILCMMPIYYVIFTGSVLVVTSLILIGLRFLIDDHLLLDPQSEYVLLSTRFLLKKTITRLCPFKDVKYIQLATETRTSKSGPYTFFSLYLVMKNNKEQSTENTIISGKPSYPGYQFNDNVVRLRDKALKIATMVGCNINYSNKIPPKERLQPTNLPEKSLLKESEKKEFSNIPRPVESMEVDKIPMDNIQSDFLCYEENKICPSCGERNSQNKYCNNCGTKL